MQMITCMHPMMSKTCEYNVCRSTARLHIVVPYKGIHQWDDPQGSQLHYLLQKGTASKESSMHITNRDDNCTHIHTNQYA